MQETPLHLSRFWASLPQGLQAPALLLLGLLTALAARWLLSNLLTLVRFDLLAARGRVDEFLRKGKVPYTPSRLLGLLLFWLVLGGFVLEAVRLLDPEVARLLAFKLQQTVPSLAAACLLCAIGYVLVVFIANLIGTILGNAGIPHADTLTRATKALGGLLVLAVALEQVDIGRSLLSPLILIFFAAAAFGTALAFGLGCKDLARDTAMKYLASLREKQRASKTDLEG